MVKITVDHDLCRKDAICGMVCPTRYIQVKAGEYPLARESDLAFCIQCGQCMAFCPHGAIEVEGLMKGRAYPVDRKKLPAPEAASLLLKSRRSIRLYKDAPLSQELIGDLIETASFAPTAKNERNIRYAVVYERARLHDLGDILVECLEEDVRQNGKCRVIPEGALLASSWRRGNDPFFRGAPHLVVVIGPKNAFWGHEDAAISLTYLEIIANAHGVGACWAGYLTLMAQKYAKVSDFFHLAADEMLYGGQMLGYPRIQPKSTAPRVSYPIEWI